MYTTTSFFKKLGMFLFAFLLLNSLLLNGQIRLVEVRPTEDTVTIKNFGSTTVDISEYYFCSLFVYPQLQSLTVDSGSLNLTADATVTLSGFSINNNSGDMGLYLPGSPGNFDEQSFMVDFMQWGDANNGRESVAVAKGIWEDDAFLNGSGPFVYNGDGTQTGVEPWSEGTLSINDDFLNSIINIYPNPAKETLRIKQLQEVQLVSATFFDSTGRQIAFMNLSDAFSETVSLESLSSGVYILRLSDNEGRSIVKKLIKE